MWSFSRVGRSAGKWDRAWRPDHVNLNWWDVPQIVQHYNETICGQPVGGDNGAGGRERLRQRWPNRKFKHAVSIGCGSARKEIALVEMGIVDRFDLFDISTGAIAAAEREIAGKGLAGHLSFLKDDPVGDPSSRYELVYWDHALHHMFDVEKYVTWSKSVLVEGGVFLLNDYVGPNRLQWTRFNVNMCRDLVSELAPRDTTLAQKVKMSNFVRYLKLYVRDPSEAAQSERIVTSCLSRFGNLEMTQIGGYIFLVIGNILKHFTDDKEAIARIIKFDDDLRTQYFHYAFMLGEKC